MTFKRTKNILFSLLMAALLGVSSAGMTGCDLAGNYMKADREADLEIQDYRDTLAPRDPEPVDTAGGPIPSFQPYIADVPENTRLCRWYPSL
ncbi:MAG: hypothetical protein LRY39_00225 [Alphaproteobacteria bacterium]|nr:hypothetical protein [Alphaproteobacteria bacterium]